MLPTRLHLLHHGAPVVHCTVRHTMHDSMTALTLFSSRCNGIHTTIWVSTWLTWLLAACNPTAGQAMAALHREPRSNQACTLRPTPSLGTACVHNHAIQTQSPSLFCLHPPSVPIQQHHIALQIRRRGLSDRHAWTEDLAHCSQCSPLPATLHFRRLPGRPTSSQQQSDVSQ